VIGHSRAEQRSMTTAEWQHLVRDVLPRIKASRMLDAAESASVPHMTKDARETLVNQWTSAALTHVRQVTQAMGDQLSSLRRFFRSHGIDPETGEDRLAKGR
jgi:hypothetical protein